LVKNYRIRWSIDPEKSHSILVSMVTLDEYFLADKRLIPNSGIDLIKIDT
jgi:hypothetical protein